MIYGNIYLNLEERKRLSLVVFHVCWKLKPTVRLNTFCLILSHISPIFCRDSFALLRISVTMPQQIIDETYYCLSYNYVVFNHIMLIIFTLATLLLNNTLGILKTNCKRRRHQLVEAYALKKGNWLKRRNDNKIQTITTVQNHEINKRNKKQDAQWIQRL